MFDAVDNFIICETNKVDKISVAILAAALISQKKRSYSKRCRRYIFTSLHGAKRTKINYFSIKNQLAKAISCIIN